jgi:hypothetical protein
VEEQVLVRRIHLPTINELLSHQRITFKPGLEQIEVLEACMLLGDGTKIPVTPDRILGKLCKTLGRTCLPGREATI